MPPLVVPHDQTSASLARLSRLAGEAPEPDADEAHRRELYLAHGRAEVHEDDPPHRARARAAELARIATALEVAGVLDVVRARDVLRGVALLRGVDARGAPVSSSDDERMAELGAFPRVLERYRAIVAGRRVAPVLVLDALFWARWNAVHGRSLVEGMDPPMLRAYHGWLVYYGPAGGTDLRDGALVEYVRAGGLRGLETDGFLRLSRSDVVGARLAFEAAFEASGNVRLRNHALALSLRDADEADAEGAPAGSGGS
jgi:hypothetical protein